MTSQYSIQTLRHSEFRSPKYFTDLPIHITGDSWSLNRSTYVNANDITNHNCSRFHRSTGRAQCAGRSATVSSLAHRLSLPWRWWRRPNSVPRPRECQLKSTVLWHLRFLRCQIWSHAWSRPRSTEVYPTYRSTDTSYRSSTHRWAHSARVVLSQATTRPDPRDVRNGKYLYKI